MDLFSGRPFRSHGSISDPLTLYASRLVLFPFLVHHISHLLPRHFRSVSIPACSSRRFATVCSIVPSAYSPTSPDPSDPSSSHLPGRSCRQLSHSSFLIADRFDEVGPAATTPNHAHHLSPKSPRHSLPVHLNTRRKHTHQPKPHPSERSLFKLNISCYCLFRSLILNSSNCLYKKALIRSFTIGLP